MSVKLYARLINKKTHEYEVINQVDAQEQGWEEHELDVVEGRFFEAGFAPEKIAKSYEEQRAARFKAYCGAVDPITATIQHLKDEEQTDEIVAEIEALKEKRKELVARIKAEYPYDTTPDAPSK